MSNSSGSAENVVALHTITSLSLDPHFPLFQHYPAMKLGVMESVRFYAKLLVPLAREVMASRPETTDWVITAPPLYTIPAGANLIAWEIHRLLGELVPSHLSLRAVDLRYQFPDPGSTQDVLYQSNSGHSTVADRVRNRQMLHEGKWAPKPEPSDFRGRAVLFINDINVTGTQQQFVQGTIETVQPASIHWLYIVQVEPVLGRSHPEIEFALNNLNLETFEDFAAIVARADIDLTSRGIQRLFSYPNVSLEPLFRSMGETRRRQLHQLAMQEGAFAGREQLALLKAMVDTSGDSATLTDL